MVPLAGKSDDSYVKVPFDMIYDLETCEKAQEFRVVEKATGISLRVFLDITNSKERILPDVVEHYCWYIKNKKKAMVLNQQSHFLMMLRHWLTKNKLNKLYLAEFVDMVCVFCLKTTI